MRERRKCLFDLVHPELLNPCDGESISDLHIPERHYSEEVKMVKSSSHNLGSNSLCAAS